MTVPSVSSEALQTALPSIGKSVTILFNGCVVVLTRTGEDSITFAKVDCGGSDGDCYNFEWEVVGDGIKLTVVACSQYDELDQDIETVITSNTTIANCESTGYAQEWNEPAWSIEY